MNNKFLQSCAFLSVFLFLFSSNLNAADYYWVGGTGNWAEIDHWATTSGGGVKHPQIPTANDNVFFDANSFNAANQVVTINVSTAFCKNITWAGVTNNPTLAGAATASMAIYGSMTLATAMRFDFKGDVTFQGSTTGNTLTASGQKFSKNLTFDNTGGEWIFQDAVTVDSSLVLKNGILKTNGQSVDANRLTATCTTSGTLDLGNSKVILRGGYIYSFGYYYYTFLIDPFRTKTVTGGSHVVECTSSTAWVRVGEYAFSGATNPVFINEVKFSATSGSGFLQNNTGAVMTVGTARFISNGKILTNPMTINSLQLSSGKSYEFESAKTFTIGTLNAVGTCKATILLKSIDAGVPAILSSTSAISADYVAIKDITTAGGGTFTANNSVKIGITTGWNITEKTAQTLYWVGGDGNWDDVAHWATSSGGAGGACLPTSKDDVVFDQNSFNGATQKANINVEDAFCKNMTWTNTLGGAGMSGVGTNNLHVYGSFNLITTMDWQFNGSVYFEGDTPNLDINTAAKELINDVYFNGDGGWILRGELRTKEAIRFQKGTWNTNNQYVRCKFFRSETKLKRSWIFGNSLIESFNTFINPNSFYIVADNLTLDAGRSEITTNNESGSVWIDGKGTLTFYNLTFKSQIQNLYTYNNDVALTFNKVRFTSGRTYMAGSMTIDTLIYIQNSDNVFNDATYSTITPVNTVLKVKVIQTPEACNTTRVIIRKNTGIAGDVIFSANTDSVVVVNAIIQDIKATGKMIVNNGNGIGNVTGWIIRKNAPRTLYWIGGTGDWFDSAHWSLTSGGAGGACIPTPEDDVFFDANSFTATGQRVFITSLLGINYGYSQHCRNMDWSGARFNPTFDFYNLYVYGSLRFIPAMIVTNASYLTFMSDLPYSVQTEGFETFTCTFNGRGIGTLKSAFKSQYFYVNHGGLITQSNPMTVKYYMAIYNRETDSLTIRLDSSLIRLTTGIAGYANYDNLYISSDYLKFDAGKSTIQIESDNGGFVYVNSAPLSVYNLIFTNPNTTSGRVLAYYTVLNYNKIHFYGNGEIWYNTLGDSLICSAGKTYSFGANATQTVRKYFQLIGNNCESIRLQSRQAGVKSTVKMDGGVLLADFVQMSDQKADGSLTFYAGAHSTNVANSNTGWLFQGGVTFKEIGFLGLDTSFCDSKPFELKAYASSTASYKWSTGETTPTIKVTIPGEYRAVVTFGNSCVIRDTIKIDQVITPVFDLGKDTVLCNNQTLNLNMPTVANASYSWQDGKTTPQYLVTQAGVFKGEINVRGCKAQDSIKVAYVSGASFSLGNDTTLCAGQSLNYNFAITGASFKWQDGKTTPQYLVNQAGTYWLEVSTNACKIRDSVIIAYVDPGSFDLGKDTTLCEGQTLRLKPVLPNATYLWQDGSRNQEFLVQNAGLFKVKASVANCSATDSIQISYKPLPKFELGNDTTLCNNDVLTLNALAQSGSTYRWQDNSTAATFLVSSANLYKVIANLNGCEKSDSIKIAYTAPPTIELGNDTTICESTTYVLKSNSNGDAFRWQDGSTASSFNVTQAGKYLLAASLKGCVRKDSVVISVTQLPRFNLGNDTALCKGENLNLRIIVSDATYLWQNGSKESFINVNTTNTYTAQATRLGCNFRDSIKVTFATPPQFSLGLDTTICDSEPYILKVNVPNSTYLWSDGSKTASISVNKSGDYWLQVKTQDGCRVSDSITITTKKCPEFKPFIPNAFSPNDDGINDELKAFFQPEFPIKAFEMQIFNRWGDIVFTSMDMNQGWDGKIKGKIMSTDIFVYFIKVTYRTLKGEDKEKVVSGDFTLMR